LRSIIVKQFGFVRSSHPHTHGHIHTHASGSRSEDGDGGGGNGVQRLYKRYKLSDEKTFR
jgi:hypothetical protein